MRNKFFDNREELLTGAVVGMSVLLFAHIWTIPAVVLCSFLWRAGGCWEKSIRRIGIPVILSLACWLGTHDVLSLIFPALMWIPLTLGYGIPDGTDEGSKLGKFFYEISGNNNLVADLLTRGTIGLLLSLTMLPIAWVNLPGFLVAVLFLTILLPVVVIFV